MDLETKATTAKKKVEDVMNGLLNKRDTKRYVPPSLQVLQTHVTSIIYTSPSSSAGGPNRPQDGHKKDALSGLSDPGTPE